MSADLRSLSRVASLGALVLSVGACSWFTDFKQQPKFDPWDSTSDTVPMRGNPQFSVPTSGSYAPGFAVSRAPLPGTVDSMSGIANPVAADARSLDNGRRYYQINCAVCHGESGKAGPEAPITKYMLFAPPLVGASAEGKSDGYLWGMIRNGRGLMPSYNRIDEYDRWDVVNYIRGLQGRHAVVAKPVGLPGETGDKLPGYHTGLQSRATPFSNRPVGTILGPVSGTLPGADSAAAPVGGTP
ncbi:MAG: cytochrome c [Gemmatimonadaceae bacterium]|nr:cytochrome c [Gemmatimonadaceae bacterium]